MLSRHGLCEECGAAGLIVHHKIPLSPTNVHNPAITLDWSNLQLLCLECHNRAHGGQAVAGALAFDAHGDLIQRPLDTRIIWGSPASGKSTYIEEHRGALDMVVDLDALREAICPGVSRSGDHLLGPAIAMRDLLYALIAQRKISAHTVWIAACLPERGERHALRDQLGGASLIYMDTSREECERRALADGERPDRAAQLAMIAGWWSRYQPEQAAPSGPTAAQNHPKASITRV